MPARPLVSLPSPATIVSVLTSGLASPLSEMVTSMRTF